MIMWAFPVFGCALLASALLLRCRPLTALAVMLGGSVAAMALPPMPTTAALVVLACAAGLEICYIAATRTRAVSVTGVAMVGVSLLILLLGAPSPGSPRAGGNVGPTVALATIIAWLIGNSIRQAQAKAELIRAQAATQAAMAERLRVARELHDIVAHSIGIIAIQAGAGRRVFDARPDEARDALAAIEATSRETLSGLGRMVTGLRHAELGPGQAPLGPAPRWQTRRIPPQPTAPTCASAGSRRSSRSRKTRKPTAAAAEARAAARQPSTPRATRNATRSSAVSAN